MLDSRRLTWLGLGVGLLCGASLAYVQPWADSVHIPEWTVASFLAVAWLATVVILDQRVHRIEHLQAQLRETHAVLESSPHPILTVSANGIILSADAQTAQIFGYAVKELIGKPID